MPKTRKNKYISELRQDIVSNDWVVIATGRQRRPHDFSRKLDNNLGKDKKNCPFEKLGKGVLAVYTAESNGYKKNEEWQIQILQNKYPAFGKGPCYHMQKKGPYAWTGGIGHHEIVISKDHNRHMAKMSDEEIDLIFKAYQDRYIVLKKDSCVQYISIFQNHGSLAGASIFHPHSQIIAIPVIPPDVKRSLKGSFDYFKKYKTCVYCVILKYEFRNQERLIYENEHFVVIAPYAAKSAMEIRIFPKKHNSHFEYIKPEERYSLANVLRVSLLKIFKGLHNPDYNFFLHTFPVSGNSKKEINYYHWHLEILPKTSVWAGFEIGTGIEISTIAPEAAADFLRNIKFK